MLYFFGIFSFFLLFFSILNSYSLFELNQSNFKAPKKYYDSDEILPLKLLNKKVHSIFPNSVSNRLKGDTVYIWLSSECSACITEFELLNNEDANNDFVIFLTDPYVSYPFHNVESNLEMLSFDESLSTEQMGKLFNISPIYFSLDSKKKIKKISVTHLAFK